MLQFPELWEALSVLSLQVLQVKVSRNYSKNIFLLVSLKSGISRGMTCPCEPHPSCAHKREKGLCAPNALNSTTSEQG